MKSQNFSPLFKAKGKTLIEAVVVLAIFGVISLGVTMILSEPFNKVEAGQMNARYVPENPGLQDSSPEGVLTELQTDLTNVDWEQVQAEANLTSSKTELRIIQTAVDTMMIREGLTEVQDTPATNNMAEFPEGSVLYPKYLRDEITLNKYTCDKSGQVKIAK